MLVGCALVREQDALCAKEIGFDYVELMGKYLAGMPDQDFKKLRNILEQCALPCFALNGYCPKDIIIAGPGFNLKQVREYAKSCGERAGLLGVKYIGIGSPGSRNLPDGYHRETAKTQLCDFLEITADVMESYGITVCLEALAPCYCNFINRVGEAVEIVESLDNPNIRTVIDFYNMEYTKEADLNLARWLPFIAHGHISDDDGGPGRRYFLKKEKKEIHQRRLGSLCREGYKGGISIEVDFQMNREKAAESLKMIRDIEKNGKDSL